MIPTSLTTPRSANELNLPPRHIQAAMPLLAECQPQRAILDFAQEILQNPCVNPSQIPPQCLTGLIRQLDATGYQAQTALRVEAVQSSGRPRQPVP